MRQIDVASAVAQQPVPAAAGNQGYFTDGDPVAGTPATVVPADFLNMVMMELVNLVSGAGIAPSKVDFTQVLKAVTTIAGGSVNLASTGHINFASGLIINWGNAAHADNTGGQAVVFDLPFPSGVLTAVVSNSAGGPPVAFHGAGNFGKTGMTVYSSVSSGVAAQSGTAFRYVAIGF